MDIMEYIKKCNKCGESQIYKTKSNYNRAIKNDTLCKKCNKKKADKLDFSHPKTKILLQKLLNNLIDNNLE